MRLPATFAKYRVAIEAELKAALADHRSPMYDMMRYHLGWLDEQGHPIAGSAGKALRPTLCLLACEACAGSWQRALPAAAALELLHNFSLIHDDIQDDDRERRHRPTVWALWGKPQAINAGTGMWVIANLTLFRLAEHGAPPARQLAALRLLNETCLRLLEGQYLDISYESRLDVGLAEYLAMIEGKTGTLIAHSLEMGALLAAANEQTLRAFRRLGRDVGLAFQIRDDLLGIWGDPAKTGKPVGSDIRRKKKTLPIVCALEGADSRSRAELVAIYQRPTIDEQGLSAVLEILEEVGARGRAQRLIQQYSARALAEVERLALSAAARSDLVEMIRFLGEREF